MRVVVAGSGGVVVVVVVVKKFLQHVFKFILCVFCGFLSQPRHRHSLPTVDIGANLTEPNNCFNIIILRP